MLDSSTPSVILDTLHEEFGRHLSPVRAVNSYPKLTREGAHMIEDVISRPIRSSPESFEESACIVTGGVFESL